MSGADRIRVHIPVIVEGKYDKARLSGVIDGVIVPTNGFSVFKNEEKRALLRRIGARGLIFLCDSDGGGKIIRSRLRGLCGTIPVYDLYTPVIEGREPRKKAPSRAGVLGVEGIPNEILFGVFAKFAAAHPDLASLPGDEDVPEREKRPVTKTMLYELGLNGTPDAAQNRARAAAKLGLPPDLSANAFCEAVNLVSDAEELLQACADR